ncbi:nuclease-like protein [Flavobacterium sp. 270]|uniref:nuclease-related domain-containing protein n=1 Tax=Flavobacterium sp. 270 TaxID=2512114 RepID=UPI001065D721|nr:nuclease-related domain-containing protein [Flavobacterium sp. 270]TDW52202.1 nuclease-like protein [Flavobacterium sp. 270]
MCRVYNTIGCLNTIQLELVKNDIDEFNSLNELIDFQKNFHVNKEKIISDHNILIEEERKLLENEITEFNILIPQRINDLEKQLRNKLDYLNQKIEDLPQANSIVGIIKDYWINLVIHINFWYIQFLFPLRINFFKYQAKKLILNKKKRFEYLSTNFNDAVYKSSLLDLQKNERKNEIINTLNNTIYGAFGEQKVENVFKKLSDDYILINDFCYTFQTALKHNGDYIKSIQIDHLLISLSGIFLIETKNWSNDSINNLDLRSPVEQIHRTSFALFKILSEITSKSNLNFTRQNWGNRKIPVKNIIVFTGNVPKEQFQFIKILGLTQLLSYIEYFNASFTPNETQQIADSLINLSRQTQVTSRLNI